MANLLYPASTGHYVDDKFSALVEPNLFAGNVMQPGLTFTDKYQTGPAGQIMVHKPGTGTVTSTAPGADFSETVVGDSLITISLNKQYNRARKIYGATVASVAYGIAAAELETALQEVKAAWNIDAVSAIVDADGIRVSSNVTTVANSNGNDIYGEVVDARQALRALKANPDVLIVSPTTYGKLLKAPEFQRAVQLDNQVVRDAYVGKIAGLRVYEYESLSDAAGNLTNINGTTADITWDATNDTLEFIVYDHDALSIVTSVDVVGVFNGMPRYNGVVAEVEIVSGFKLTNASRAILKIHDNSATEDLS
jgi:hypothetical protein